MPNRGTWWLLWNLSAFLESCQFTIHFAVWALERTCIGGVTKQFVPKSKILAPISSCCGESQ